MPTAAQDYSPTTFNYVHSDELLFPVQIRILSIEGVFRSADDPTKRLSQCLLEAQVYCNSRAVGFPVCTSYKPPTVDQRAKDLQKWNEWLTLPVRYSDLSRDAFVHFTLWELSLHSDFLDVTSKKIPSEMSKAPTSFPKSLLAQTHLNLFSKHGLYKTGTLDLQLELSTKSEPFRPPCEKWKYNDEDGTEHFMLMLKQERRQRQNLIDNVSFLDKFAMRKNEKLRVERKSADRSLFLVIEMARVRYDQTEYHIVHYAREISQPDTYFMDPEMGLENLCEAKHNVMTRTVHAGEVDRDRQLKPNTQTKHKLETIIKLPSSHHLTQDQRDLVWKFRFFLKADRRALTKFLHSVNWEQKNEVQQAAGLINEWVTIEAEDALELLSPAFTNMFVRSYAVSRLLAASPEQMLLYLPQLVQALKYEPQPCADTTIASPGETSDKDGAGDKVNAVGDAVTDEGGDDLASFLIKYATGYPKMANFLYWHLIVEEEATKKNEQICLMYRNLQKRLFHALQFGQEAKLHAISLIQQKQFVGILKSITGDVKAKYSKKDQREMALRTALSRSVDMNELKELMLPLDPSIRLVSVLSESASFFSSAMAPVKVSFRTTGLSPANDYTFIFKEGDDLSDEVLMNILRSSNRDMLSIDNKQKEYNWEKVGEPTRVQDQLVIQMIRLMDSLFKRDQLDLKLTPYSVLATGTSEGFVQFIKAKPLREVMKINQKYGEMSIREAMRNCRPPAKNDKIAANSEIVDQLGQPMGIEPEVVDNYVRSLAGYSVVCYVLGVGDRHLDNLMLCENGKLFHVDFGFILGRDPKPMPPPMKLTTEMLQAMGGMNSAQFKTFCQHCDSAYRILRRHANVILNLFSLMLDAGIPDIEVERDKAVSKVEQRLCLSLSDEAAFRHMISLIEASISAKMAMVADIVHDWKQNLGW